LLDSSLCEIPWPDSPDPGRDDGGSGRSAGFDRLFLCV
jgi:hypothetical protein